jgi:hypothetical protein
MDDPTEQESTGSEQPEAPAAPAAPTTAATPPATGGGDGTGEKPPARKAGGRGPVFYIGAGALLIASVFGGKALIGTDRGNLPPRPSPTPDASPSPTAPANKEFRNVDIGITFEYPADWQDLSSNSVEKTTIALVGTGGGELLKLDVFPLEEPPTTEAVASNEVRDSLDKIIARNETATVTLRELKSVNGVPAWHYIAQFRDPDLGVGIHDVWFFFSGKKLEKLTFQAFPISEYNSKFKAVFDGIVATYRTVPRGSGGATPAPASPAPAPSPR